MDRYIGFILPQGIFNLTKTIPKNVFLQVKAFSGNATFKRAYF